MDRCIEKVTDGIETGNMENNNERIKWEEYFMGLALLTARRSKDPVTKVGACIVNEDLRIVGMGYNGMPNGCVDNPDCWAKERDSLKNKHLYVCHAAMNAIINKYCADLKGCTMYVTIFPCNECAKLIIQSRIKKIVYKSDKFSHKIWSIAAKQMFSAAKIDCEQFTKDMTITLDLSNTDKQ